MTPPDLACFGFGFGLDLDFISQFGFSLPYVHILWLICLDTCRKMTNVYGTVWIPFELCMNPIWIVYQSRVNLVDLLVYATTRDVQIWIMYKFVNHIWFVYESEIPPLFFLTKISFIWIIKETWWMFLNIWNIPFLSKNLFKFHCSSLEKNAVR